MSGRRGRSFGANVLISFAFTGLLTGLAFTNSVVIARWVGAEGRGLYALGVAALGILIPLTNLGLSFSSTWALGRRQSLRDVSSLNHLWSGFVLLVSGVLVAGGLLWFGGIPEVEWALVAMVALGTLPAAVYSENTRGVLLGLGQVVRYNTVQTLQVVALLVGNLTLLGFGPRAVLLTLVLGYWAPAVLLLLGHVPHALKLTVPPKGFRQTQIGYGVKATGTHLVEVLLIRLDYLLVTPIVGVAALGLYSVSDQIATVMAWGGQIAGRMMLAESSADQEGENARWKLGLGVRTLIVVVGVAAIGAAATGWWIIPTVFGAEFESAFVGMLILLPAAVMRGSTALIGTYLMGRNVIRPVLVAGAAAIVVIVVGSPLAAWAFGWLGVAAVRVLAVFVQLALIARAYRATTGERFRWVLDGDDISALVTWTKVRFERVRGPRPPEK
ncbi:MAG: oligosaccharide flippase family protein [Deltaproteobacteria bacterium]|nr:oligosaccharide flippase family protein [Deltaproteobacteria bacterium]